MFATSSLLSATFLLLASVATSSPTPTPTKAPSITTSTTSTSKLCGYDTTGIVKPTNGATIVQSGDGFGDPTYVEVVYCSSEYYKTSSLDASIWLSEGEALKGGGLLVIEDQKPDNRDTTVGLYSYRFNVTIFRPEGDFQTGERKLTVYEAVSDFRYPARYEITSINVNLTVAQSK